MIQLSKLKASSLVATEPFQLTGLEQLSQFIKENNWTPAVFNENYRKVINFKSTSIFALDVDGGKPFKDMERELKAEGLNFLIGATRSHQKEKGGIVSDRYRVILPLKEPITSSAQYYKTFYKLQKRFPFIDAACKDPARFFYPCTEILSIGNEGQNYEPAEIELQENMNLPTTPPDNRQELRAQYGKLPLSAATKDWLKNAAPQGERHARLIKAAKDANQQLWTLDEFLEAHDKIAHAYWNKKQNPETYEKIYKQLVTIFNAPSTHAPRIPVSRTEININKTNHLPDNLGLQEVFRWLTEKNFKVSYDRTIKNEHDEEIAIDALTDLLVVELASRNISITKEVRTSAINRFIEAERHKYRAEIVNKLCNGPFDADLHKKHVIKFLKLYKEDPTELDVAALSHSIWQIKRKLSNLEVKYHMMFCLYGREQGTGKSYGMKALLSPLGELLLENADFNILTDPREGRVLNDSFAVIFDEMSNADKASMESIKRMITADKFKQRVMQTTNHTHLKQNSTFFSTANKKVGQLILDDTGLRRFYECNIERSKDECKKLFPLIKEVDFLNGIFIALDHTNPISPIEPYLDALYTIQEDSRHRQPVEAWIEDSGLVEWASDEKDYTDSKKLLTIFNEYDNNNYNSTRFGRELSTLKGAIKKRTRMGSSYNLKVRLKNEEF